MSLGSGLPTHLVPPSDVHLYKFLGITKSPRLWTLLTWPETWREPIKWNNGSKERNNGSKGLKREFPLNTLVTGCAALDLFTDTLLAPDVVAKDHPGVWQHL